MRIDLVQGSLEWREFRKRKIGASDAPSVMGVGFLTPLQLWRIKVGLEPEKVPNSAMKRGTELEKVAREKFIEESGIHFEPACFQCDEFPYLFASLDGYNEEHNLILEVKCPGKEDHEIAGRGLVPEKYEAQLQHQMFVAECDQAYYYSFDGENGISVLVERDDEYIAKMLKKEKEFYQMMTTLTEPPVGPKDWVVCEDYDALIAAMDYERLKKQSELLQEKMQAIKEELIKKSKGEYTRFGRLKLHKIMVKARVDYDLIPELKGVDLDKYRSKPSISYRIDFDKN